MESRDILSHLRETIRRFPDRPAVSDAERTLTYRELCQAAERYAAAKAMSVGGRANLVEARASVDFAVAMLGTHLAEGVFVPFAKNAPTAVVHRIERETETPLGSGIAEVLFTTGTTGASKGVMLSRRAVWASADDYRLVERNTEESVWLIASPLNHVGPLRQLQACLLVGAHAVLQDGFVDMKRYYEAIERHRVNALFLPPSAVTLLILVSRDRLHALSGRIKTVYSSGAPMAEGLKESLRRCLPDARLIFSYGTTESSGVCCAYDYAELPGKASCVGKAVPHANVTVENGRLVLSGETVMDGYLHDATRTAKVLRGGKVYTNDLGRVDEDGLIYVIGRSDDIINCGGLKVAPTEVEDVAMRHPAIADCACFGIDDPLTGSAVKLNVVPLDATSFDLVSFRTFLQERLERHQLPARIDCVARIPRTANGKVDRKQLT